MKKATALVLYYTKDNKCSFRALVGALETEESLKNLKVFFLESEKELIQELDPISRNHQTTILGFSFFTAQLRETEALVKRLKEKCERRIIFSVRRKSSHR